MKERKSGGGSGSIFTPHAGPMIIHIQRESGLAHRTIVLSQRRVQQMRILLYCAGAALILVVLSWFFLASQAARVPILAKRVATLQHDVSRLDTLERTLAEVEKRFQQVQKIMGATATQTEHKDTTNTTVSSLFASWPLLIRGKVLPPSEPRSGSDRPAALDIAAPVGTDVLASGDGEVSEITEDSLEGTRIRIDHLAGYQTLYSGVDSVRIKLGDSVESGQRIALTGRPIGSSVPHLHFELWHGGRAVDPSALLRHRPGSSNGNLQ